MGKAAGSKDDASKGDGKDEPVLKVGDLVEVNWGKKVYIGELMKLAEYPGGKVRVKVDDTEYDVRADIVQPKKEYKLETDSEDEWGGWMPSAPANPDPEETTASKEKVKFKEGDLVEVRLHGEWQEGEVILPAEAAP